MRTNVLLFAVAALLAVAPDSSAQSTHRNNTIRGKVRSTDGRTVNNAIVELKAEGGGLIGQTATSNDGDFEFTGLIAGAYEVDVTAPGYSPAAQEVRFNHGPEENFQEYLSVEVTIRPRPDQALAVPGTSFAQDVPKSARAAYEKGMAKLTEGKSVEGIALLHQATELYNDYFNAYYALGAAYYSTGRLAESLEALEHARKINDRDGAVYHLFGLVMLKEQKFTVAEYAFKQACGLSPDRAPSHFYRAHALVELAARDADKKRAATDLADADKELTLAWDLSNKKLYPVYLETARVRELRGDIPGAVTQLEEYLKADPEAKNAPAVRQEIVRLHGTQK